LSLAPSGEVKVLLDGLAFANGVALDPEGEFVLVAETGKGRIHRVWLKDGRTDLFAEVPGLPDNLSVGSDGLIWCAVPAPPNPQLTGIHKLPKLARKLIARVPESLGPKVERCCRVCAYDREGRIVHILDGDPDTYHHVTGVRERDGRVWIGSIMEEALAWFDL
jgi:sugar lactone lactonase YvrE